MLADLIGEKSDRKIDKSQKMLITRHTLRLDDDVYQMSNITGFGVAKLSKHFPWKQFLFSLVVGLAAIKMKYDIPYSIEAQITYLVGYIAFWYNIFILCNYFFINTKRYGLSIQLNSGREIFLSTPNKAFLSEIVTNLYEFMDMQKGGSMTIDVHNHSIYIAGNFQGNLAQGGSTAQGESVNMGGPFNGNFVAGNSNHLN